MGKILTIAIPMFNMEKYIQRCLDSLLINDPNLGTVVKRIKLYNELIANAI